LSVGDRATCLFKDCLVYVTGWTDAPISWPRCLPVGERGHPSLLVDDELARAVRTEAAAAVMFWHGQPRQPAAHAGRLGEGRRHDARRPTTT
jgi:hypothetical protein